MAIDHTQRHQTIAAGPETDLAEILDLANDAPVIVERGGIRYMVERDPMTPAKPFDAEAFRKAARELGDELRASGVDFARWKREIRYMRGHDDDPPE